MAAAGSHPTANLSHTDPMHRANTKSTCSRFPTHRVANALGGGVAPRWRRDGKELYYISADSKMMAVEVSTTPVFTASVPKILFQLPIRDGAPATNRIGYGVTADGKKFLINTEMTGAAAPPIVPITVILNWPALLKK